MTYPIEKDIPRIEPGKTGLTKYPFAKMDIGDSFFLRCAASDVFRMKDRIRGAARIFRRRHLQTARFEVRSVSRGVRCWRIA